MGRHIVAVTTTKKHTHLPDSHAATFGQWERSRILLVSTNS